MDNKKNLLDGKRGLVMGVANNRSIAWGIAKACYGHGAKIALSYQGEAIKKRVLPLAKELNSELIVECDVSETKSIDKMFEEINKKFTELGSNLIGENSFTIEKLSQKIRTKEFNYEDKDLINFLYDLTVEKIKIDNPKYK